MTKTELKTELEKVAKTFYLWAPIGTKVPYIVFTWDNVPNVGADDHVYQKVAAVVIQSYFTDLADLDALDTVVDSIGYYVSSCVYDDNSETYIKTYTLEVIDNG